MFSMSQLNVCIYKLLACGIAEWSGKPLMRL